MSNCLQPIYLFQQISWFMCCVIELVNFSSQRISFFTQEHCSSFISYISFISLANRYLVFDGLLWFLWIELKVTGQPIGLSSVGGTGNLYRCRRRTLGDFVSRLWNKMLEKEIFDSPKTSPCRFTNSASMVKCHTLSCTLFMQNYWYLNCLSTYVSLIDLLCSSFDIPPLFVTVTHLSCDVIHLMRCHRNWFDFSGSSRLITLRTIGT